MLILQLLIGIFAALGIGLVLADLMRIPSIKASKAANNLGRKGNKKTGVIELYLKDFATKLAGKLHLNEIKRAGLELDLKTANMDITPEQYTADAIVKGIVVGIFAIPVFFISKIIAVLILGLAVFMYIREKGAVTRKIKVKRDKIDFELPSFVSHIEKTVPYNRDLVYILESYAKGAGPEFREELTITIAEMRASGDYQSALQALDSRIGSSLLTQVTSALAAVENSTDTTALWASLSIKFSDYQKTTLKAQANAIPRKVKKLSMLLMFCFLLIYIAVIGQVLMNSMSTLF